MQNVLEQRIKLHSKYWKYSKISLSFLQNPSMCSIEWMIDFHSSTLLWEIHFDKRNSCSGSWFWWINSMHQIRFYNTLDHCMFVIFVRRTLCKSMRAKFQYNTHCMRVYGCDYKILNFLSRVARISLQLYQMNRISILYQYKNLRP